ncbi:hypothetical protein PT974_01671 [Cladobotryum mycophilum]|uniref:C2H2-type domain-containing protein n=1 Tax=Cladobotryum mycophilum TaxID=491253 RepID=A0ABR0T454_9HYPO
MIDCYERKQITQAVGDIQDIIQDQAQLKDFEYPPPIVEPIPFIQQPKDDGLRCVECGRVYRQVRRIQEHCRKAHNWVNEWSKGGNVVKRAKQAREVPWITGVRCQRFFQTRAASGWFEVGRDDGEANGQPATGESTMERITRIHQEQAERFEASTKEAIRVGNEKMEPNAWLDRVGWAAHLQRLDPIELQEATGPIQEHEAVLQKLWESLERVMDQARATAVSSKVGAPALFEVQRKEIKVKPARPFDNRLEDDTWVRYKEVYRKLLCVIQRTQQWDDNKRPPYKFTPRQGDAWDDFEETIEKNIQLLSEGLIEGLVEDEKVDRLCLDMVVKLLNHQMKQDHYDNAIISGLAVLGIQEDKGWMSPLDYTPIYSAVIKIARMLVLYQSYLEREDEVAKMMRDLGMDEDEAREEARGVFRIVRTKVQRFMTQTTHRRDAEPTPMDWIMEMRTYGMYIRYNTVADGTIDWDGDRVIHRRIRFGMGDLSDMLHTLKDEARGLLAELTIVDKVGLGLLPVIEWGNLEDSHSEQKVGYSFLQDDRNEWLGKGKDWIIKRIAGSSSREREWIFNGGSEANPYKAEAVRKYGQVLEQFRERLFVLMHMVAGQPARSMEILGLRMVNTVNGGSATSWRTAG